MFCCARVTRTSYYAAPQTTRAILSLLGRRARLLLASSLSQLSTLAEGDGVAEGLLEGTLSAEVPSLDGPSMPDPSSSERDAAILTRPGDDGMHGRDPQAGVVPRVPRRGQRTAHVRAPKRTKAAG